MEIDSKMKDLVEAGFLPKNFNYLLSPLSNHMCIINDNNLSIFSFKHKKVCFKLQIPKNGIPFFSEKEDFFFIAVNNNINFVVHHANEKFVNISISKLDIVDLLPKNACYIKYFDKTFDLYYNNKKYQKFSIPKIHNIKTFPIIERVNETLETHDMIIDENVDKSLNEKFIGKFKSEVTLPEHKIVIGICERDNSVYAVKQEDNIIIDKNTKHTNVINNMQYDRENKIFIFSSVVSTIKTMFWDNDLRVLKVLQTIELPRIKNIVFISSIQKDTKNYLLLLDEASVLVKMELRKKYENRYNQYVQIDEKELECKKTCLHIDDLVKQKRSVFSEIKSNTVNKAILSSYNSRTDDEPVISQIKSTEISRIQTIQEPELKKEVKENNIAENKIPNLHPALEKILAMPDDLCFKNENKYIGDIVNLAKKILYELAYVDTKKETDLRPITYINSLFGERDYGAEHQQRSRDGLNRFFSNKFTAYLEIEKEGQVQKWFLTNEEVPIARHREDKTIFYVRSQAYSGLFAQNIGSTGHFVPNNPKYSTQSFNYKILKKNKFKSQKKDTFWDAITNQIELENTPPLSPPSLLKVLNEIDFDNYQDSQVVLSEQQLLNADIYEGYRRQKLETARFKDISILNNTEQENAFRQPMHKKIVLTGVAGTGKTSVLVKRISQNIDQLFIHKEDLNILIKSNLSEADKNKLYSEEDNWIVFSPNEKAKEYLEEAFNAYNVRATGRHLRTWDGFKSDIIKDIDFFKDEGVEITNKKLLKAETNKKLVDYERIFDKFVYNDYLSSFKTFYSLVGSFITSINSKERLKDLNQAIKEKKVTKYIDLLSYLPDIQKDNEKLKEITVNEIEKHFSNKKIINIIRFVAYLRNNNIENEDSRIESLYRDFSSGLKVQDIDPEVSHDIKKYVESEFKQFVKKGHSKKSKNNLRNFLCLSFKSNLKDKDIKKLNKLLLLNSASEKLRKFPEDIVGNILTIYLKFRNQMVKDKSKFLNIDSIIDGDQNISDIETDVVLYHFLKNIKSIGQSKKLTNLLRNDKVVETIFYKYRTQVLIDEVSDFSSIQVACMYNISHPVFNSIFITGDLLQRTNDSGLSKWEELDGYVDYTHVFELKKVYRQSHKMLDLIQELYNHTFKSNVIFESAYPKDENDPDPVCYRYSDEITHYKWIYETIKSINREEVSIAIFLNNDESVQLYYEELSAINDSSLEFKMCFEDEAYEEYGINIVNINNIKGVEFEAVFIPDIDFLCSSKAKCKDNLLYVALSRSAGHLYLTYKDKFPEKLSFIRPLFKTEGENVL